jgi:hypothetical protein
VPFGYPGEEHAQNILAAFDAFEVSYSAALKGFLEKGLDAGADVAASATSFGSLLSLCSDKELPDTVLGGLLRK